MLQCIYLIIFILYDSPESRKQSLKAKDPGFCPDILPVAKVSRRVWLDINSRNWKKTEKEKRIGVGIVSEGFSMCHER